MTTARFPALLAVAFAGTAVAQQQTVVVTGGLREARVLDAPYAITSVDAEALRSAGPMVNLSEALARVPGLVANNRSNYAQDLQISARGFGARAGFGVRGVRLYADGIPATMPDGSGQVAHFDLAGAERVEVLRGPFSALYGNSSGGVIAVFTAPATEGRAELAGDGGSFGLRQVRGSLATPFSGGDVRGSASHFQFDGFRPHAAARRTLAQGRLALAGERDDLVLVVSDHEQRAQDPLGLSRAQFNADPRQTTPEALQYDTRKTVEQQQAGLRWRHRFDGALREASLMLYGGSRDVAQWLAIAPATQANPRHGGGVVDLRRDYDGGELRLRWQLGSADIAAGVVQDRQADERRGYLNYTGSGAATVLGVTGALRRDETDRATSRDAYVQANVPITGALSLAAGVRSGRVALSAADRYLANGDDSGSRRYRYTNPVLGLKLAITPQWMLHAGAARGFESPTLNELAYRSDGSSGFNAGLSGQRSRQVEVGSKWRGNGARGGFEFDAALFDIRTRDEIGVQTNSGGRSAFQNVGRTRRYGIELSGAAPLPAGFRAAASLSLLYARYLDGFLTCTAVPCTLASVPVPAGNRIAGTQRGAAWAEVQTPAWAFGRFAVEWRAAARTTTNDLNTDPAAGYGLVNLRWTATTELGAGQALQWLARVDNVADKTYAGSVIVGDTNGRYYEPGLPRNALVSVRWLARW